MEDLFNKALLKWTKLVLNTSNVFLVSLALEVFDFLKCIQQLKLFIITILKNLLVNNLINLIIPIHSTLLYQVILTGGNMINNFNHINNIPLFYGKYKFINKYNPVF